VWALTFLRAVVQVVEDGCENGGQVHAVSTLRQAQCEQLTPAEAHQLGLYLLPATPQPH